ncbi:ThiF family adenylyltransferase [Methylocaldum sp.]|uniref:ThiF family adenylyltransferase n=1 Tax=Methylocaldum sp. TaxID=1969727 RepID=UPI002D69CA0B|nr:ThiF family adenylyltransferase [Methylocaldum sp.]HYE36524.1 ThiF family adenylyltransferase [Methylocaldum sp.]
MNFDYLSAFSRNIGWITYEEQQILRTKRIAIAGLGGVGGSHLLTLTRLGVGGFNIADMDIFELANFNRQTGADVKAVGLSKVEVMAVKAREINPTLELRSFSEGVTEANLTAFLDDVDLYIDGLDFFALDIRAKVFAACTKLGIPAITAAPLGMGVALLNFLPGRMTFEEYFGLENQPENEQIVRFLMGLSPGMLQTSYLVEPRAVNLALRRGPSTAMACELCAGVAATEALKILLRRGKVFAAPWGIHFDAYRNKLIRTWRPGGNQNPLQRIGLRIARKKFLAKASERSSVQTKSQPSPIEQILELARWAPSGDNTQPWRFEIIADNHIVIHGFDTRDHCVYDFKGRASQIAIGALLENIAIAASSRGLAADWTLRPDSPETAPTIDVYFSPDPAIKPNPLIPYIPARATQRRAMKRRPLNAQEKMRLTESLGDNYTVLWLDKSEDRLKSAWLMFRNGKVRLTMPEAYEVHKNIIQWNARVSEDRIPDRAVGLNPLALGLMKWAMRKWSRVNFLNTYMAGTLMPRVELDLIPGIFCAGHFALLTDKPPASIGDYLSAGRALQRFWLTATRLGLQLQPEMTPLIFASYIRESAKFTCLDAVEKQAKRLANELTDLLGDEFVPRAVFMGRIGEGQQPEARSIRKPLSDLLIGR